MQVFHIGRLASRIGVQPQAIRYYERRGLLPRPRRAPNGYRLYTAEHLERVDFIKNLQTLALSLEEIRDVMDLKFGGDSPCLHVRDLLREKIGGVNRQIARLQAFRRDLAVSLKACEKALSVHSSSEDSCPTLERLHAKPAKRRKQ